MEFVLRMLFINLLSTLKHDAKRIDDVDLKHIDDKYTIYKLFEKNKDIANIETKYEDVIVPNLKINKIVNQHDSSVISYFKADKSHENRPDLTSIFRNIQMPDLTQIFPFWT